MRFAFFFPLFRLPGFRQSDEGFLAIDGRDEDTRVIAVFGPIWKLRHCQRPLVMLAAMCGVDS